MTYKFQLLLINYIPKWAYENLYRPLCNCACCCNDCSVSCYYFSLTCDSPFFFFFFLKSCMLSFLQIQIQAVLLGVNLMLLKLQLLLVLLRYVIISWKNSYEHSTDWNSLSLSLSHWEFFSSLLWQENLGSGSNLYQKESDPDDAEIENSESFRLYSNMGDVLQLWHGGIRLLFRIVNVLKLDGLFLVQIQ